jgi:hypothetical protein
MFCLKITGRKLLFGIITPQNYAGIVHMCHREETCDLSVIAMHTICTHQNHEHINALHTSKP